MSSSFFQNRACPYFPCHENLPQEDFNCLFCFCPLYALKEACGGAFTYTKEGIKDCSACTFPHVRTNYGEICARCTALTELCKKTTEISRMTG